ncbi:MULTISPECIES: TIGR02206 family membrane protein [Bacillus]|uniref:TIGR02206 family membrane protein n=1 Tax=Bacillus glycinifermentans TaxID=1664069 RepID=A0AAJ3Z1R3_9BACI|nr:MULTISPECIES: TIGR02206 family membrane protein [Bacillus]KKB73950.1 membrane protein [Bacillus sp. TH008]MDU0072484.1 TIGR02206 family membrane protein [Bacillus sp. IG6]MED8020316.1 TIGR02206 family membrane protein [Bacillus glycinifermentans]QAT67474.1 TIGR02206 family membrane protein [Bacillus glycinifermentans]WKB77125.1 TIGR02206 family membrane protein [Bacillus glycinifermentans]
MNTYFRKDYHLGSFHFFSTPHIVTLLVIAALGVCLFVFRRTLQEPKWNRVIRYAFVTILIISEISYHSWFIYVRSWTPRYCLPLHLSDLSVYLVIILLLTKNLNLFKFLYFAGLGSALQAMLTPDLGRYGFPHFRFFEFFISHGLVVLACLFMVAAEKYKPTVRSLWITFLIINVYTGIIFVINRMLESNYMYMMRKPGGGASLLDVLGPWPWYILSSEAVTIVFFYLLYAPFWMKKKMER